MLERIIEAILFMSPDPVKVERLSRILKKPNLEVKAALANLIKRYNDNPEEAIEIVEENGFYMRVKDDLLSYVKEITPHTELTKGELKTLAYISNAEGKTGVLQSDVIKSLGSVYEHIHVLEDRGFIKSKPKGRSKLLYTTPKFRMYFKVDY